VSETISIYGVSKEQKTWIKELIGTYAQKNESSKGQALYKILTDYIDLIKKGIITPEVISVEDKRQFDELQKYCDRGLMQIIGGIPVCGKKSKLGIGAHESFIYPKDHPDEDLRGQTMRYEDIMKSCELCKQSFTEDPRIKQLIERMTIILDKGQSIELYFCYHPQIENIVFTAFRDAQMYCPKFNRYVNLEKNCILKGCEFMNIMKITAPSPKPIEE